MIWIAATVHRVKAVEGVAHLERLSASDLHTPVRIARTRVLDDVERDSYFQIWLLSCWTSATRYAVNTMGNLCLARAR